MKRRDIGILMGLGVLVILVGWYFLVIAPKRDSIAQADIELQAQRQKYETDSARVKRIDEERSAARLTTADLLKLNKLIPIDSQVPSLIVELQQSANEAGVDFMKIKPGVPIAATGGGNTIVPFDLKFDGRFFDVNDFLYRVENYARLEGNDVNVSGRLLSVVAFAMAEPESRKFPFVSVSMSVNAYMTSPPPASAGRTSASRSTSGNTSTTRTTGGTQTEGTS